MSWAVRLGDEKNPLWLTLVDDEEAVFSPQPRLFRTKSFAQRMLKKTRNIVDTGSELTLVQL